MTSFLEKHETGQSGIKVVKFARRKNYYLYVYDKVTKKVSYQSLDSEDLDWCMKNWFQGYNQFIQKGGSPTKIRRTSLISKCKEYVDWQYARFERGEIKEKSFKAFWERMRNGIIPYIENSKYQSIHELNRKSFVDFAVYWRDKGKQVSTIRGYIMTFKHYLNWLVDQDLLDLGKCPQIKGLRQVKDYRTDANPAFVGEDWKVFRETLWRYEYLDDAHTDDPLELERWWIRKNFVLWVLFQFHSGNRPHETEKLTYGDIKVEDFKLKNGATTKRGLIQIPGDTKRGERTSVMNGTYIQRIVDHFKNFQHPAWLAYEVTDETPLFVNPNTGKSFHQQSFRVHYQKVLSFAGLDGRGYTPYSLRSTHITRQLLNRVSVDDIARNLGTSSEMIRKHYDGVQNILKSDDLLQLNKHYYSEDQD